MHKILIVEDEEKIARFIELELMHEGYDVTKAHDGRTGLQLAEQGDYDLMLLDIMLPGINGLEVLRRLRKTSSLPVIILTARDEVMDRVTGLDMGADDYICKPFSIEELLARIRSALRKRRPTAPTTLRLGPLEMDVARYEVSVDGNSVELTNREFELLRFFLENQGIVLTRETLIEKVWGYDYVGETNVVDVYIRYLRQKIDDPFNIKFFHTVRGVGYVLKYDG